ncbi:MAG: phosphotransferase [Bacillus sp. (in: firmicutes)]
MKVINMPANKKGDDDYLNRLFSYFQLQFYEKIIQFVPLRKTVFFLKTEENTYIIKGYSTNSRLRLQEVFTDTLKKEGFTKTYSYLTPLVKEQLFFEGTYFGCIQYIPPHKTAFTYHTERNRQEGLDLLEQYHQTTRLFVGRYRTLLSKGHLLEKWLERLNQFTTNLPYLKHFIKEPILMEMVSWAKWALAGMEQRYHQFYKEPIVILHGDVAHHNFLRDFQGQLHLIDFDLISIGPPAFDYLQYANRILPFMDWSLEKLEKMHQMKKYLHEEAFLYALAYPADIFREWNRLIREKSYTDSVKIKQVVDLSTKQFYARKRFVDQLQEIVK